MYWDSRELSGATQISSGHIFQVSSLGCRLGSPGLCVYQASKWAVGGFSTGLSTELAPLGIKVTVLEPGGIKTDWAGPSMQIPPASEHYQQTVGSFAEMLRTMLGNEVSIRGKVAKIIVDLTKEAEPPLRLLLGTDAAEYAGQGGRALAVR